MATSRQQALSVKRSKGFGSWAGYLFGFVFCGLFLGVGSIFLYMLAIQPMLRINAARSWIATPCKILSSDLGVHRGDDSDTYSIDISYEYERDGEQYVSEQYAFQTMKSNSRKWRDRVVKSLPPGKETTCFVNPADPFDAVLERGWTPDWPWIFFPIPFVLIGVGGFIGMAWHAVSSRLKLANSILMQDIDLDSGAMPDSFVDDASRDRPAPGRTVTRISSWSESEFDDDDLAEPPGPVTLKPETSPFVAFLALLVFGLFWNGVVSVFLFSRLEDWMQGKWQWMPELFLIPFVLVGLGFIAGAGYTFLALFNPTPLLTLSRQWIPLGADAELSWTFVGNARSIRQLTVTLEGAEEARYRRGTSTYTDTEVFYSEVLLDSTDREEIERNEGLTVRIPTDSMHTFTGSNNKVIWNLNLRGDIPLWPDVSAKFPIRVIPHE